MEKKYLLSLITKYSNIQLSIIDSNSFSIHSTSTFNDNIFKLFDELFVKYGDTISIVFNNNSMVTICNNVTNKKYKIMYTTGCFDIFHYGHLNILSKSKELCQKLIVGVSTDELILKEKGKLPVIPFLERVKIVESIKYVDMVVPQTNKNKQEAIDKYNIEFLEEPVIADDFEGYKKIIESIH